MNDETFALDQHLCFALYGASMAIGRLYKPVLDEAGITYPQYLVLSTLWERDGLTIGAIAERLALESSTITPLVKRLEANGFVARRRNAEDERQVLVTMTEAGRAMRAVTRRLGERILAASAMSPDRFRALNAEVRALRDAVAAATERPPER
ncbi:MarR family winged helix-turn-helix transcriptional regulator [Jiella avicenniae]|uniref:MarR family transcriptional regulator n=1 Tax=Jiella avicenniae TaxID=2907202 RepID=A0A9X1NYC1_9HYPH|nr:MarR family transcriptional regulator [Jiella avicenniae]MCE7027862.1 MarR family transcriptional regulator [Jiella avicenniae]